MEELHLGESVGQGSFGVVLLAEYSGTKVAIKQEIAPGDKRKAGIALTGCPHQDLCHPSHPANLFHQGWSTIGQWSLRYDLLFCCSYWWLLDSQFINWSDNH